MKKKSGTSAGIPKDSGVRSPSSNGVPLALVSSIFHVCVIIIPLGIMATCMMLYICDYFEMLDVGFDASTV